MSYLNHKDFIKRIKLFFKCFSNEKKFIEYVNGKNIAIVGNAESLFNYSYGRKIDSADIVIRFNSGFIINSDNQGTKTNIWASSLYIEEEKLKDFGNIDKIIWLTPKLTDMKKCHNKNIYSKMNIYPFILWLKLYLKLNKTRPTSGCMMLNFLIEKTKFKKIDIYGFDFFKTNSFYNKQSLNYLKTNTPHKFADEENYFLQMTKQYNIKIHN